MGNADAAVDDLELQHDAVIHLADDFGFDGDGAFGRELHGVAHEIDEYLTKAAGVATQERRQGGRDVAAQRKVLEIGLWRKQIEHAFDQVGRIEGDVLEFQPVRFQFGEIEDVVDDGEQRLGGFADRFRIDLLIAVELGIQKHPCHTDDTVHGGTDFMAHGGQEFGFDDGSLLRFVPRHGQVLGESGKFDALVFKACMGEFHLHHPVLQLLFDLLHAGDVGAHPDIGAIGRALFRNLDPSSVRELHLEGAGGIAMLRQALLDPLLRVAHGVRRRCPGDGGA